MKCSLGISNFLKRSLVFSIVLFSSLSLHWDLLILSFLTQCPFSQSLSWPLLPAPLGPAHVILCDELLGELFQVTRFLVTPSFVPGTVLASKPDLNSDARAWVLLRTRSGYYITLNPIVFFSVGKEWTKLFLPRNLVKVVSQPRSQATLPLARVAWVPNCTWTGRNCKWSLDLAEKLELWASQSVVACYWTQPVQRTWSHTC